MQKLINKIFEKHGFISESAARMFLYLRAGMMCESESCIMTMKEHIAKYNDTLVIHYLGNLSTSELDKKEYKRLHKKAMRENINFLNDFKVVCYGCHAKIHGIAQRKIPPELEEFVIDAFISGRTMRDIANELELTESFSPVFNLLKRNNITRQRHDGRSNTMKEKWKDPEFRKKMMCAITAYQEQRRNINASS